LITELAQTTLYSLPLPADGSLYLIGDKTISRQRRNDGPKNIKLIVANLDNPSASAILNVFAQMGCRSDLQGAKKWSASEADASHWEGGPIPPCDAFSSAGLLKPTRVSVCSLSTTILWRML